MTPDDLPHLIDHLEVAVRAAILTVLKEQGMGAQLVGVGFTLAPLQLQPDFSARGKLTIDYHLEKRP